MNQLPSDGLDTFATLADVEMKKLDEQVRHGFNRVIREASKAGMINSSNAMVVVAAEAANSVPVRAHTLQNLMVRCLSDYGVPMSKATAEWATERLRTYLVHQCGSLRDLVRATAPFQGSLSYGAAASDAALSDIDNKAMHELRRIEAAFNLMVAAASRQGASDNNSGSQTNVFHGPVNVVQGPGSYSVAQLNLNADAKDKLVSALDAIASALSQQDAATLPFDADEVRPVPGAKRRGSKRKSQLRRRACSPPRTAPPA